MTFLLSAIAFACTHNSPSKLSSVSESTNNRILKVWWDKGFTLEEDEALQQVVSDWEKQTGNTIKLSFYTTDELPQKAQRALQAGNPPDILMSHNAERVLNPRLAWEGKLADVSDVIQPIKSLYPETVLAGVYLYNNIDQKRSYYAVPISQAITHIFYWRDLLQLAGKSDKNIPKTWDAFWELWKQVQNILRTQNHQKIYGLGLPTSVEAGDTYQIFEQILEAYSVELLDSKDRLRVDDPKVRQGIIDSLDWYTKFYQQGYVPPDAVKWLNPDNNRQLLNRFVVMTPNSSHSIPAAVRSDLDIYYHKLGTIEFPHKPNGQPMRHLVIVRQAVIFAESQNQKLAKDFLTYLSKPEVIGDYLKAAGGRNLPVLKPVWQDPFWTNPNDPHISAAARTILEGQTRLYYSSQNPAYSIVLDENVWGKALTRIVLDRITPEQAADEAIARIQQIFAQWR
ncbi:ABC transporter substrate-binding protein [Nostoc minutum NIES-26]|uniref:ABC transporter substrate-binding protein n=1 Tax=Nostoc minutum NIES-26 TaxID=1844469 RepID=A0A367Q6D1_9NOSO|nr:ABC transporter substrate-binding protein [Nostoc minutum NIES-26]